MDEQTRREFLTFMGYGLAAGAIASALPACVSSPKTTLPFQPIKPSAEDMLKLAPGFSYHVLLRWQQPLNKKGDRFGFNNDYLAFEQLDPQNPHEGLLWVNHEYHDPYLNSGWRPGQPRTLEQVNKERKEVGGSIVHVQYKEDRWYPVENSKYNRRLDGFTKIPMITDEPIMGTKTAIGTFANCAGGKTPWGTFLTCEENYHNFIGEAEVIDGKRVVKEKDGYLSWNKIISLPPEHYGWVVEIDPKTGKAKKLTALGRFAHECATTIVASDGRTVVYTGDDDEDEHLYKFISAKPGSLEKGELFVADTVNGKWISLAREKDERLKQTFKSQTDLLIHTRQAAKLLGATPLDRPEDIEIHPGTKAVIVACSANKKHGRPFGSLLKIEETNADPLSMTFKASTFASGGKQGGFACPDNLAFDAMGNLWMCSDIAGTNSARGEYAEFGNNGLFYIPFSGPSAGRAFQVASAPNGAEFTGPLFTPDGKTLLLSVQHPGERGHDPKYRKSNWPDGGDKDPAPCVVQITGSTLEKLVTGQAVV